MNRKQFIILLVLVAVLGAWGLHRWRSQSSSWSGGGTGVGQKLLGDFQVNDVAQISIKHGTNELTLAKKNDLWRVAQRGDYPANFSEIVSLLTKLKDLKVVQTETVGTSQLPRLELAASGTNSPTTVEFRDEKGKAIKTLLLGKKHMRNAGPRSPESEFGDSGWPDGRYVMAGSSGSVAVVSDALADVEPNPESWLNKDFFKIEKPKTISVTFTNATNSWKLTRETESAEWKLADAKADEKLDSSKASGVENPFSSPNFNDVVIGAKPEQTGLDKPTVVSVETFDGLDYTVKVGAKTNDNFYLTLTVAGNFPKERTPGKDEKAEDKEKLDKEFKEKQKKLDEKLAQEKAFEPWTYLASSWQVDQVLKGRSELLAEKKEEPKKDEKKPDESKPEAKDDVKDAPKIPGVDTTQP